VIQVGVFRDDDESWGEFSDFHFDTVSFVFVWSCLCRWPGYASGRPLTHSPDEFEGFRVLVYCLTCDFCFVSLLQPENYRDVFVEGDCDSGVRALSKGLCCDCDRDVMPVLCQCGCALATAVIRYSALFLLMLPW
jgi:hypothetical protein